MCPWHAPAPCGYYFQVLDTLVSEHLVPHMPLLQRLVDSVALLDMMLAFAGKAE